MIRMIWLSWNHRIESHCILKIISSRSLSISDVCVSTRSKAVSWAQCSQHGRSFEHTGRRLIIFVTLVGALVTGTVRALVCTNQAEEKGAAQNCGIIEIVGDDHVVDILLEGLIILQNRGYDSAGIASIGDEGRELAITKYASKDSTADSMQGR